MALLEFRYRGQIRNFKLLENLETQLLGQVRTVSPEAWISLSMDNSVDNSVLDNLQYKIFAGGKKQKIDINSFCIP